MKTAQLTLTDHEGMIIDSWDIHWADDCEDLDCIADFHISDLESITGALHYARKQMENSS